MADTTGAWLPSPGGTLEWVPCEHGTWRALPLVAHLIGLLLGLVALACLVDVAVRVWGLA